MKTKIIIALLLLVSSHAKALVDVPMFYTEFLKCYAETSGATHEDIARFSEVIKDATVNGKVVLFENKSPFSTTDSRSGIYLNANVDNCRFNNTTPPTTTCTLKSTQLKWDTSLPAIRTTGISKRMYLDEMLSKYIAKGGTSESFKLVLSSIVSGLNSGKNVQIATLGVLGLQTKESTGTKIPVLEGEVYTSGDSMSDKQLYAYTFNGTCSNGEQAAPDSAVSAAGANLLFPYLINAKRGSASRVYIYDEGLYRVLEVDLNTGLSAVTAGNGTNNQNGIDGLATAAALPGRYVTDIESLPGNRVLIFTPNYQISPYAPFVLEVGADGILRRYAGNGQFPNGTETGNVNALNIPIDKPAALDYNPADNSVYITDDYYYIWKINDETRIATIVKNVRATHLTVDEQTGKIYYSVGKLIYDLENNRLIGSMSFATRITAINGYIYYNTGSKINRINAETGIIEIIAGTGTYKYIAPVNNVLATTEQISDFNEAAILGNSFLFPDWYNDYGNHGWIRKIDTTTGIINTMPFVVQ